MVVILVFCSKIDIVSSLIYEVNSVSQATINKFKITYRCLSRQNEQSNIDNFKGENKK